MKKLPVLIASLFIASFVFAQQKIDTWKIAADKIGSFFIWLV